MELKGFSLEKLHEDSIIEELSQQGIDAYERKCSGNILDGTFKQEINISRTAFTRVCVMLTDERREKNLTKDHVRELIKRLRHRNIALLVSICLLLAACFLTGHFINKNSELQANIENLESTISNCKSIIRDKESEISDLEEEIEYYSAKPNGTGDESTTSTEYTSNYEQRKNELYEKYGSPTEPTPALTPSQLPYNGRIVYPSSEGYPESGCGVITIEASNNENYYVKLRDVHTNDVVLSFIVHAGMSVDANIPFGEYVLTYAYGNEWYGYEDLFGPDTSYAIADDTFLFEDYGDSVTWWKVELYLHYNGNLDTESLDSDEF